MSEEDDVSYRGKGQAGRLGRQHEAAGGPLGIFGVEAQNHDRSIRVVSELLLKSLSAAFPKLLFRHRATLTKKEIHAKLQSIDARLGQTIFVANASIQPDGGIIEVQDKYGEWRVIVVSESKHQGNDVEKIRAGIKQGKNKDADFMVAGNAIERVHKNIAEFQNYMLGEIHFPYVVFLQGSNFATESFDIIASDGRKVHIQHDAGSLNRIDRVTAANYGMKINQNDCPNIQISTPFGNRYLQVTSLFFQCDSWTNEQMLEILTDVANTSLDILSNDLVS